MPKSVTQPTFAQNGIGQFNSVLRFQHFSHYTLFFSNGALYTKNPQKCYSADLIIVLDSFIKSLVAKLLNCLCNLFLILTICNSVPLILVGICLNGSLAALYQLINYHRD